METSVRRTDVWEDFVLSTDGEVDQSRCLWRVVPSSNNCTQTNKRRGPAEPLQSIKYSLRHCATVPMCCFFSVLAWVCCVPPLRGSSRRCGSCLAYCHDGQNFAGHLCVYGGRLTPSTSLPIISNKMTRACHQNNRRSSEQAQREKVSGAQIRLGNWAQVEGPPPAAPPPANWRPCR